LFERLAERITTLSLTLLVTFFSIPLVRGPRGWRLTMDEFFVEILLKKLEGELLLNVLPVGYERCRLEQQVNAASLTLELMRSEHDGRYFRNAPMTPLH